eukprot:CAMPEP_0177282978 /NCGR_PEP_ID=MMETSP0367-20130122/71755_1 /TAXON_ID=447022 ORGANISM="Scrippsiella hangoei-like, Strain SHHI-4" /NCGR_SAMPLE_ID=MMETSP0367 /ASSEMBLY_ACC=CAM_ASM_000362 /LENGTH=108 /DNA_ID=CAMNT_0018739949 /DNA_START=87 /DNA_END=410 /DNA_ORIENTATION=+
MLHAPQTRTRHALLGDDRDADALFQDVVRHHEGDASLDPGVRLDGILHLEGRDNLAAPVDDLLRTAGNVEVAVLVQPTQVAGVEPAVLEEALLGGHGVALVALEERRP